MNYWIDLHALWQIVVVGLLAGAGLPALFAVGLGALSLPGRGALPAGRTLIASSAATRSASPRPRSASRSCWPRSAGASTSS